MSRSFAIIASLCALSLWAADAELPDEDDEDEVIAKFDPELSVIKRSDSLAGRKF